MGDRTWTGINHAALHANRRVKWPIMETRGDAGFEWTERWMGRSERAALCKNAVACVKVTALNVCRQLGHHLSVKGLVLRGHGADRRKNGVPI